MVSAGGRDESIWYIWLCVCTWWVWFFSEWTFGIFGDIHPKNPTWLHASVFPVHSWSNTMSSCRLGNQWNFELRTSISSGLSQLSGSLRDVKPATGPRERQKRRFKPGKPQKPHHLQLIITQRSTEMHWESVQNLLPSSVSPQLRKETGGHRIGGTCMRPILSRSPQFHFMPRPGLVFSAHLKCTTISQRYKWYVGCVWLHTVAYERFFAIPIFKNQSA